MPEPGLGRCGEAVLCTQLGHLPQKQVKYLLCFLAERLGNVYLKGGLTGCAQA